MRETETNGDDATLALRALIWTLAEPDRAQRLLAVTGIDPADLRARIRDRAVLAATLGFLLGHEPDLVACADDLGVAPAALAAVHGSLER